MTKLPLKLLLCNFVYVKCFQNFKTELKNLYYLFFDIERVFVNSKVI